MSDNWIRIIPQDPFFVPKDEAIAEAEEFLAKLAPEADEIDTEVSDGVKFRDCGVNLSRIGCPLCHAEIDMDWWVKQMGDEDDWDRDFDLKPIALPCGHVANSLNDLEYDWEQGFSRFVLDVMNPLRKFDASQITQIEAILACPVKVIYQHL